MLNPKLLCLLSLLISVRIWAGSSEDYESALNAYNNKEYSEAYIHLKNSLQKDPNNLPAKILMGKMLLKNTYFAEAETELIEALELGADINLIIEPLGNSFLFQHKYEDILQFKFSGRLSKVVEFNWLLIRATANLNLKKFDLARQAYLDALTIAPNNLRALNSLASLELAQTNTEQAAKLIAKSLEIDNNDPRAWHLKGELAKRKGDYSGASTALQRAFAVDAEDPLIKRSLVDVYIKSKNYDAARHMVDQILQQTPDDPMAMLLNSWLLAEQEQNTQAIAQFEELNNRLSNVSNEVLLSEPTLLFISALSLYANNKFEQASSQLSQYIAKEPGNIAAITLAAQTHLKLGQNKLALSLLEDNQELLMANLDAMIILGDLYISNNRTFKVIELLTKLQKTYSGDPRVELLEIKTLAARGKLTDALKKIQSSMFSATDPRFLLTRSMLHMQLGQFDQANEIADVLYKVSPLDLDYLNLKVAILIKLKQFQPAKSLVQEVLKENPEHFSARFNLATILSAEQDFRAALEVLTELVTLEPNNVQALIMLARTQATLGDNKNAITNLQSALTFDSDNLQALELLGRAYEKEGRLVEAVRQFNKLTTLLPTKVQYQLHKAQLYLKQHDEVNLKRQLRDLIPLCENNANDLFSLSKLQIQAKYYEAAKQSLTKAVKLAPDNIAYALEQVKFELASGEQRNAERLIKQLDQKFPNNANVILLKGDLAKSKQLVSEAASHYNKALQLDPTFNQALVNLYQLTLTGDANELFEREIPTLLQLHPNNNLLRNLLADFYINQHEFPLAKPHYEYLLAVKDYPIKAYIYNNLANIVLDSNLTEADKYIQKALELDKNSASILDTQGWILTKQQKYHDALTVLRKAFSINSKDPIIRYHLALTLVGLGRVEEARKELEAALDSHEKFSERLQAQKLLDSM